MPKKTQKPSALTLVGWIQNLDDQGGTWGRGVVETTMTFEADAEKLDKDADQLGEQVKELRKKAADLRNMAVQTARRADRDAVRLFDAATIANAKAQEPSIVVETGESAHA